MKPIFFIKICFVSFFKTLVAFKVSGFLICCTFIIRFSYGDTVSGVQQLQCITNPSLCNRALKSKSVSDAETEASSSSNCDTCKWHRDISEDELEGHLKKLKEISRGKSKTGVADNLDFLERMAQSHHVELRRLVARILNIYFTEITDKENTGRISKLFLSMKADPDDQVRDRLCITVVSTVESGLIYTKKYNRESIIDSCAKNKHPMALNYLKMKTLAKDPSYKVRREQLNRLLDEDFNHKHAGLHLEQFIDDPDAKVRVVAVQLSYLLSEEKRPDFLRKFKKDASSLVRSHLVNQVLYLDTPEIQEFFRSFVSDPSPVVRRKVVHYIVTTRDEKLKAKTLKEYAKDPSPWVKSTLIYYLEDVFAPSPQSNNPFRKYQDRALVTDLLDTLFEQKGLNKADKKKLVKVSKLWFPNRKFEKRKKDTLFSPVLSLFKK